MPTYTAELSGLTPYVVRKTFEADSIDAALAEAERMLAEDPIDFGAAELLRECDTPARVTGLWAGEVSHYGDDLRPPAVIAATDAAIAHDVAPDPVRDAAHELLAALREAVDFHDDDDNEIIAKWRAAIAKAECRQ